VRIDFPPSERTSLGPEWELQLVDLLLTEMRDPLNLRSACAKSHLKVRL